MSIWRVPLIAGVVALLLVIVFWFLLLTPRQDERAALLEEAEQIRAQQQQVRLEIARLEEIARNELVIQAQLARLEEFVPTGVAQPRVIRQFQLTADGAGVEIGSMSFSEPTAVPGAPPTGIPGTALASVSVSMAMQGGYFQIMDFFRRIEQELPRAVLVDSLALSPGEAYPILAANWTGSIFALVPAPEAPPEGDVPVPPAPTPAPEAAT